jgi:hypothetical protein
VKQQNQMVAAQVKADAVTAALADLPALIRQWA